MFQYHINFMSNEEQFQRHVMIRKGLQAPIRIGQMLDFEEACIRMDKSAKAKYIPCAKSRANKKFTVDKQFITGFSSLSHDQKIVEYCETVRFLDCFLNRNLVQMPELPQPEMHTFDAYLQQPKMMVLKKWVSDRISIDSHTAQVRTSGESYDLHQYFVRRSAGKKPSLVLEAFKDNITQNVHIGFDDEGTFSNCDRLVRILATRAHRQVLLEELRTYRQMRMSSNPMGMSTAPSTMVKTTEIRTSTVPMGSVVQGSVVGGAVGGSLIRQQQISRVEMPAGSLLVPQIGGSRVGTVMVPPSSIPPPLPPPGVVGAIRMSRPQGMVVNNMQMSRQLPPPNVQSVIRYQEPPGGMHFPPGLHPPMGNSSQVHLPPNMPNGGPPNMPYNMAPNILPPGPHNFPPNMQPPNMHSIAQHPNQIPSNMHPNSNMAQPLPPLKGYAPSDSDGRSTSKFQSNSNTSHDFSPFSAPPPVKSKTAQPQFNSSPQKTSEIDKYTRGSKLMNGSKLNTSKLNRTIVNQLLDPGSEEDVMNKIETQNNIVEEPYRIAPQEEIEEVKMKKDYDIFHCIVPEFDLKDLFDMTHYSLVKEGPGYTIHSSDLNRKNMKLIMKIDHPKDLVLAAFADPANYKYWNQQVELGNIKLRIYSQNSVIAYQKHKAFSQMYRQRDFLFIRHLFKKDNITYMVDKSIEHSNFPPFSYITRGEFKLALWAFKEDCPGAVHLTYMIQSSFKGSMGGSKVVQLTTRYLQQTTKINDYLKTQSPVPIKTKIGVYFDVDWDISRNQQNKMMGNRRSFGENDNIPEQLYQTALPQVGWYGNVDDLSFKKANYDSGSEDDSPQPRGFIKKQPVLEHQETFVDQLEDDRFDPRRNNPNDKSDSLTNLLNMDRDDIPSPVNRARKQSEPKMFPPKSAPSNIEIKNGPHIRNGPVQTGVPGPSQNYFAANKNKVPDPRGVPFGFDQQLSSPPASIIPAPVPKLIAPPQSHPSSNIPGLENPPQLYQPPYIQPQPYNRPPLQQPPPFQQPQHPQQPYPMQMPPQPQQQIQPQMPPPNMQNPTQPPQAPYPTNQQIPPNQPQIDPRLLPPGQMQSQNPPQHPSQTMSSQMRKEDQNAKSQPYTHANPPTQPAVNATAQHLANIKNQSLENQTPQQQTSRGPKQPQPPSKNQLQPPPNKKVQKFTSDEEEVPQMRPEDKHIVPQTPYTLNPKTGLVILPNDYLRVKHHIRTIPSYPYIKLTGPKWKNYFLRDLWEVTPTGQLKFVNQEKLKEQHGILAFVLKKFARNLLSGKSILNFSLPVSIFSQLSILELAAKGFGFAPLFYEKAAKQNSALERFKYAIIFSVSYSLLYLQMQKPFNPILGQTYQGWLNGCPIVCQQICHHPPITAFYMVGRGYKVYGSVEAKVDIGMNSGVGSNDGEYIVEFDKWPRNKIRVRTAGGEVQGLSFGERKFLLSGKSYIYDDVDGFFCQLAWNPYKKGLMSFGKQSKPSDTVEGSIVKTNPDFIRKFRTLPAGKREGPGKKQILQTLGNVSGRWTQAIKIDGVEYLNTTRDQPCALEQEKYPLNSNSNYRQDIIYRRRKDVVRAQTEKERLEVIQRQDRTLRQKRPGYKPH